MRNVTVSTSWGMVAAVFLSFLCVIQLGSLVANTAASSRAHSRHVYKNMWEYTHAVGDLPALLSSTHGPNSTSWTNSVAICAVMKEENSTDVREWLLYYQWLGVDHVYLSENAASPTSALRAELDSFVKSGFLTYTTEPMPRSQLKAYYDCMTQNYDKHNWLAFFDIDEFLILMPGSGSSLSEFLDAYRHEVGLSVHWVLVGPSGRRTRPEAGGVLRHYRRCAGEGRHMVKTVANTFYLSNVASHPHNFEFRDGRSSVDELGRPVLPQREVLCWPAATQAPRREGAQPSAPPACRRDAGFLRSTASVAKVALFHYATKSEQDFAVKMQRGSAIEGKGKPWSFFHLMAKMAGKSGGICNLPAAIADRCCPQEALTVNA